MLSTSRRTASLRRAVTELPPTPLMEMEWWVEGRSRSVKETDAPVSIKIGGPLAMRKPRYGGRLLGRGPTLLSLCVGRAAVKARAAGPD
ncbi:hypothetical protein chiPu_0012328 [Chiloscyllium punctatum]|uniref:Uncharacterized protein n=1 Tax=Chiloscyllium punctatum TaxID=137246 RepID=A0A401STW9_CHIPU|nr:hypothetical protein [Chiloscyllium punctatum]